MQKVRANIFYFYKKKKLKKKKVMTNTKNIFEMIIKIMEEENIRVCICFKCYIYTDKKLNTHQHTFNSTFSSEIFF